jgi:hypothetical protein
MISPIKFNPSDMPVYYLMKVKGKAKIPDYIQLRDEALTLIGYFRPGRKERLEKVVKNPEIAAKLQVAIDNINEYGKLTKVKV